MTPELELTGHGSREALRAHLRDWLSTQAPISDQVLAALLISPRYAHKLGSLRDYPQAVEHLLAHPPLAPLTILDGIGREPRPAEPPGDASLAVKAGASALRWIGEGLRLADGPVRERRWAACMACPHMADPPARLTYRVAGAMAGSKKICRLCGCNVRIKGRLPHERCPDRDPANPALSRWGEPIPTSVSRESES